MTTVTTNTGKHKEVKDGLWKVFSKHYPELSLSMKELIDNAIAAIQARQKNEMFYKGKINIIIREVTIEEVVKSGFQRIMNRKRSEFNVFNQVNDETTFEQLVLDLDYNDTLFLIEIHDNGIGISNFGDFFKIGKDESLGTNSFLNEHGTGVKNALAQANIENDAWEICTSDIHDVNNKCYKRFTAPYKGHKTDYDWDTIGVDNISSTGTAIKVVVTEANLITIGSRISKNYNDSKETAIKYFKEDIAVTYSEYLLKDIDIEVEFISRKSEYSIVGEIINPIKPIFEVETQKVEIPIELREGSHSSQARIEITEGFIKESKTCYYFRHTLDSPKVLTYLNGRLIGDLWNELFTKGNHNSYNQYQLIINIFIEDKSFIPSTNATKTDFVRDDYRYKEIIKLVKKYIPQPKAFRTSLTESERKKIFIENLENRRTEELISDLFIGPEDNINNLGKADAYISYSENKQRHHELFEFKKGELKLQHVFQLLGYVHYKKMQEIPLSKAILVVDSLTNNEKDIKYNEYIHYLSKQIGDIDFEITTYKELGIPVLKDYKGSLILEEVVGK